MVQEVRVIINTDNVLRAGFTSDLGDDKGKEDIRKDNSAETLKTNIKLALNNKKKGKYGKQTLGRTKKPLIKQVADTEIMSCKLKKL